MNVDRGASTMSILTYKREGTSSDADRHERRHCCDRKWQEHNANSPRVQLIPDESSHRIMTIASSSAVTGLLDFQTKIHQDLNMGVRRIFFRGEQNFLKILRLTWVHLNDPKKYCIRI